MKGRKEYSEEEVEEGGDGKVKGKRAGEGRKPREENGRRDD